VKDIALNQYSDINTKRNKRRRLHILFTLKKVIELNKSSNKFFSNFKKGEGMNFLLSIYEESKSINSYIEIKFIQYTQSCIINIIDK